VKPGASWNQLREDIVMLVTLTLGSAVNTKQLTILAVDPLETASDVQEKVVEQLAALDASFGYLMYPYVIKVTIDQTKPTSVLVVS
jgi:hypothetical protein